MLPIAFVLFGQLPLKFTGLLIELLPAPLLILVVALAGYLWRFATWKPRAER